jgi:hypothetical protein
MRFLIVLAVLLAACGSPSATPSPTPSGHDLKGTILLTDAGRWSNVGPGDPCEGQGGYDDIIEGADVVVRNQADEIIATSSLGPGTNRGNDHCAFAFTVEEVPDAEFYSVEVSHRGALTYSKAELDGMDWNLSLNLGG